VCIPIRYRDGFDRRTVPRADFAAARDDKFIKGERFLRWQANCDRPCQRKGSTAMDSRFFFSCRFCLVLAACVAFGPQITQASDLTRLSGSYEVIGKTDVGPKTTVRLHVHLTNQGRGSLSIQRMALRDFSHPTRDQVRACALTIPAGASSNSTQEFTLPRIEYETWQRGNQPTVVLEIVTPSGHRTNEVVRLTQVLDRKGN
jgi:hypothetical protein